MQQENTKHLITWKDWQSEDIKEVLELASKIKQNPQNYSQHVDQKTLVMLFQKTSTRTRVSFEAGMTQMGGHAIFMDWLTSNFGLTEIRYESAYLSRNSDILMARMKKHEDLLELQKGASIPVINGCCNLYHPCQGMADMLTVLTNCHSMKETNLTYVGVHNNVVNSLLALCEVFDVHLTLVCPIVNDEAVDFELKEKIAEKGLLTESQDLAESVKNAEFVYTDTWIDMEFFNNPEFKSIKEERIELMLPFQINAELMRQSNAKIMHDMPIHTGYEITDEMVEHPNSIIYEQAENRLHAQKAIMLKLLNLI